MVCYVGAVEIGHRAHFSYFGWLSVCTWAYEDGRNKELASEKRMFDADATCGVQRLVLYRNELMRL